MKKSQRKILDTKLDKEEQEISDAFDKAIESGQFKSITKLKEELAFTKNESIVVNNVKNSKDLESFKWGKECLGWVLCNKVKISIIYEKMPSNTQEIKHYNEHTWQFFFIIKGQATMSVDGLDYLLEQHQFIEIPKGMAHQIANPFENDLEFLVISTPNRPVNDRLR